MAYSDHMAAVQLQAGMLYVSPPFVLLFRTSDYVSSFRRDSHPFLLSLGRIDVAYAPCFLGSLCLLDCSFHPCLLCVGLDAHSAQQPIGVASLEGVAARSLDLS
jgi:hypothetical protein